VIFIDILGMKILIIILISYAYLGLLSSATPDWLSTTNEEYLGSNDEVYAVMKTVADNQGNYYSSREVKSLFEYSKNDNAIINQELVSDIVYNIDADHMDPNTPPKVTKVIKAKNTKLLLSALTTDYNKPNVATAIPAWTKRLSWKNDGLYLDANLLVLPESNFTEKEMPFNKMKEKPLLDSLVAVYQDDQCIYFSLKYGDPQSYQNRILRASIEMSKQINDWSTKLSDYLLISEHPTKKAANTASIELIEIAKNKDYYAINLEIWSAQREPNNVVYYVVHRPFDLPIDIAKIKLLNSIIERETKTIKSNLFLQKWIPYVISKQDQEEPEEES